MKRPLTIRRAAPKDRRQQARALARCAALGLALLLASGPSLWAQQGKPGEYRVKAVYLFNFGKFVQWPAGAEAAVPAGAFPICVLGRDPFGTALDEIARGERIDAQPLVVRRIDRAEDAMGCRILFISTSEQERVTRILELLQGKPVVTVGEMPGFCDRGGMIQFGLEGDRVRFQVNTAFAEKAGLSFSSQLLKVATSVRGASGGEK